MGKIVDIRERFHTKYVANLVTKCWLWTGARKAHGPGAYYGKICVLRNRRASAHRVSYEIHKGPIPTGMLVCHSCDTPLCVNPEHLWLGTAQDNTTDMMRKGRAAVQRPGHTSPRKGRGKHAHFGNWDGRNYHADTVCSQCDAAMVQDADDFVKGKTACCSPKCKALCLRMKTRAWWASRSKAI